LVEGHSLQAVTALSDDQIKLDLEFKDSNRSSGTDASIVSKVNGGSPGLVPL